MLLTVREAARLLGVSDKVLYRWIDQGVVPVTQVEQEYRFNKAELLEWATTRRMKISPEIFRETGEMLRPAVPHLSHALERGGVHHQIPGRGKAEVFAQVAARIPLPDPGDRGLLASMLLAREAAGATGIGDGVAIPHVRNPLVLHVRKPVAALCFLEHPLELEGDPIPIRALFVLVCPTPRSHLQMLSRLAAALHDTAFKEAVLSQAPRETLLNELARVEASFREEASAEESEV
jgi:PTS system nitrogen regulatory IIA component